jgi:2,4-dienoyl-CoA reductase-like NADH-dependent reductase (Old Yellow Enzyme family)
MAPKLTANTPAANVPYYTPAQQPPPGTAANPATAPTLFQPLQIRSVTLTNRFVVSPMCTYSADDGHVTDWHLVHLGQYAQSGAGLIFVEATAVQPRGRISPEDSGLWTDSQIAPLKRINDYIHAQGQKSAIQLAHAGRKASCLAPWITIATKKSRAGPEDGGWGDDVLGPSAIPFDEKHHKPKELTLEQIKEVVKDFAAAAKRAVAAGFGESRRITSARVWDSTDMLFPFRP